MGSQHKSCEAKFQNINPKQKTRDLNVAIASHFISQMAEALVKANQNISDLKSLSLCYSVIEGFGATRPNEEYQTQLHFDN